MPTCLEHRTENPVSLPKVVAVDFGILSDFLDEACEYFKGYCFSIDKHAMQRAIGDIVEGKIAEWLSLRANLVSGIEASEASSKRSMEDVLLRHNKAEFCIDIKCRNTEGQFSMPNLVSVERLSKYYQNPGNFFILIFVEYKVLDSLVEIQEVSYRSIETISWDCLSIRNLGRGQIQLTNARNAIVPFSGSREDWVKCLVDGCILHHERVIERSLEALEFWKSLR